MSEDAAGPWGQLIPELWYDLIARIPAGVVFWSAMFLWQFASFPREKVTPELIAAIPAGTILVLALLGAYVVAIAVTPLSVLSRAIYARVAWRRLHAVYGVELNRLFARFRPPAGAKAGDSPTFARISSAEFRALFGLVYEHLKRTDVQAKVLLPKMMAEARLCDNIAALLTVFAVIVAVSDSEMLTARLVLAYAVSIVVILSAAWYRYLEVLRKHVEYATTNGLCV